MTTTGVTYIKRRPRYPAGEPHDGWTLKQLRRWVEDHAEEGVRCPACERQNKWYHRSINDDMAKCLIEIYRVHGKRWGYVPRIYNAVGNHSGDVCKLRFWGFMVEEQERRPDGGRKGYWRITNAGEQFVLGQLAVRSTALLYNNRFMGFEGPWVAIEDCLGEPFDLRLVQSERTLIRRRPRAS